MKISKADIEAIIEASSRTFVPLHQLVLSVDHQARTAGSTPKMSVQELAASIQACGVLQNLIVVKGSRGTYEVCAGGRRLEALSLLVSTGALPDNYPVPVLIVPAGKALIASLAENALHVPMHPADEFDAFGKLLAQGQSAEDVAAAFGVTPLVVKRRMRLAAVSPKLIAQFRKGEIGLDCLMVLASVEDHERQEQAWAGLDTWSRHPDCLRRVLTQGEVESDRSPVAKYVTVKAYEKAGGPSRRDLFSDDDKKVYLLDATLLDQLAVNKLQRKAKQVGAEGWKWVDVRPRYVQDEYARYGELRKCVRDPDEAEAAELAQLEADIAERTEQLQRLGGGHGGGEDEDDGDGDGDAGEAGEGGAARSQEVDDADEVDEQAYSRLEAECDALTSRLEAMQEALSVWPSALMTQAGCVVYVGRDAAPAVRYGLIRPEDRAAMAEAAQAAQAAHAARAESGEPGFDFSGDSGDVHGASPFLSLPGAKRAKARSVHSERLMRNLTAHRVAAIQAELLSRPDVALAVLTAQMAGKLLIDGYIYAFGGGDALTLSATNTHTALGSDAPDIQESAAWQALEAERQLWGERLPGEADELLPWVLAQDGGTIMQLFTFLVATTVTGVYGVEPRCQRTEGLARALGLDMRNWWQASAASYFNHVSKSRICDVVTEVLGAQAAAPLSGHKKEDAARAAELVLAGKGWLPSALRVGGVQAGGADDSGRAQDSEGQDPERQGQGEGSEDEASDADALAVSQDA